MFRNRKSAFPALDEETAGAILNQVFEACGRPSGSVPLHVLASYTQYRRDRYSLQKGILIFMMAVFLLLPLGFIPPKFTVERIDTLPSSVPVYEVRVHSLLPVRQVYARLDDVPVTVYESRQGIYTVEPRKNGRLSITVALANRQYDSRELVVSGVDTTAPVLLRSQTLADRVRIYLEDTGSGIDYPGIYGRTDTGETLMPLDCDTQAGWVDFAFPSELRIFVPDRNGNTLQLVLKIRSASSD